MSQLVNPFGNKGQGNPRERLNALELEVARLRGVLMTYGALFEMMRRYFVEVTNASQAPASTDKQDSCKPSEPESQEQQSECTQKDEK